MSRPWRLDHVAVIEAAVRSVGAWCLYLSVSSSADDTDDIACAAPYLDSIDGEAWFRLSTGEPLYVFGEEADLRRMFEATVGDDGPTATNRYDGPARVYAMLVSPTDGVMTENT